MFRKHLAIILLAAATILLAGACTALFARTLVNPLPVIISATIIAAAVSMLLTRTPRGIGSASPRWLRAAVLTAAGASLLSFLFLIVNYTCADKQSARSEKVCVSGKYYKTRHRNKRVGRRYLPTGEEYHLYYIDLDFGHRTQSLSVDFNRYRTLHKGDSVTVTVAKGALGPDVMLL